MIPNESPEERELYESLRDHEVRGFFPRGSLPHTEGAAWVAVDEYWDKYIEQNEHRETNKIGHALTRMLRHGTDSWHPLVTPLIVAFRRSLL